MHGMLRQADTNGDGAISRAEFEAAAAQRFARMDTNGDGTVSTEERRAARAAQQ
ncbi:EF-hand domain-containing protein [Leptolyngbya sp. 15MV]|nr:EF-hand domain-containing protein [Leptolyngbya sp. 15MV]